MQQGLRSELQRILLLAIFLLIVGGVNGHLLLTLVIGSSIYFAWTLYKVHRFYLWLDGGARGLPPESAGVLGDISDVLYRQQQRNLRAKNAHRALAGRVRKITSALDNGILVLSADRTLDWWNPAATELLRLRPEDRGQHINNLIRHPGFVRYMQAGQFEQPIELPMPSDETRILQYSAGTFGEDELVLVAQDITRMRRLEEMRKEFVANISHELRTPLTVLMGYIETMLDAGRNAGLETNGDLPPQWKRALQQMSQQTERLNSLTEDLVMLSRLESTPAAPTKTAVDLKDLLKGIVDSARLLFGETHRLILECEEGLSLLGEAKELHSAFSNLIFNAVRHNPEGCDITVQAKKKRSGVSVKVVDNGVGIDPKHLPRLTERFYRADNSRASISGGTGLGLAIVKHVLMRHHGKLEVRSTLGKGSIFSCRFTAPE